MAGQDQLRLMLNTTDTVFEVSIPAKPKLDMNNTHKHDRNSGLPMWTARLYARGRVGDALWSAVFDVTVVAAEKPSATVCQQVVPLDLEALPWASEREGKTRTGIAYKASALQIIEAPALVGTAA
jgi:hypothetical protein